MSATLVVRHPVTDYTAWREVYDSLDPLRTEHGCTGQAVQKSPADANDLLVIHDFPSVAQAESFAHDPRLREGMDRAGVAGAPRIEIFESV